MIVFLALRYVAGSGITGVVETAAVGEPGEVGRPGAGNPLGKVSPGIGLEKMQDTLLAAVLGESVRQQSPILARVVPVEGDRSGRVEAVGIHQHAIDAVDPLPHIQHGLVLAAVTSLVEVPTSDGYRHTDGADHQQLLESLTDLRALDPRREVGLGQGILTIGPVSGLGGVSVLEPTVGIGNRLAMQDIDCVAGWSWRVARINHPG